MSVEFMDSHTAAERVGMIVILSILGCTGILLLCAAFYVFKAMEFMCGCFKYCCRCCRWCCSDTDGEVIDLRNISEYEFLCPIKLDP